MQHFLDHCLVYPCRLAYDDEYLKYLRRAKGRWKNWQLRCVKLLGRPAPHRKHAGSSVPEGTGHGHTTEARRCPTQVTCVRNTPQEGADLDSRNPFCMATFPYVHKRQILLMLNDFLTALGTFFPCLFREIICCPPYLTLNTNTVLRIRH